MLKLQGRSQT